MNKKLRAQIPSVEIIATTHKEKSINSHFLPTLDLARLG